MITVSGKDLEHNSFLFFDMVFTRRWGKVDKGFVGGSGRQRWTLAANLGDRLFEN